METKQAEPGDDSRNRILFFGMIALGLIALICNVLLILGHVSAQLSLGFDALFLLSVVAYFATAQSHVLR